MEKDFLANTLLAFLIVVITVSLWEVGEVRVDAYIALYVLAYVVIKAILSPKRVSRDWLFIVLLAIFFLIVGYRIYEVLVGV